MSRDIDDLRRPEQAQCDEHDRCLERDKAECEWCQYPAVAHSAQQYDWRNDLEWIRPWTLGSSADQAKDRLAAYIERLEAERDALLATVTAAYFLLNSDQCTHGDGAWNDPACRVCNLRRAVNALPADVRDRLASMTYAERVIHGEQDS